MELGEESHPLDFRCGICGESLTDSTAVFTSCGHFFCGTSKSSESAKRCTSLWPESNGECEQCGTSCNAGVLKQKAAGYDARVKSFVFNDIIADLRGLADIVEFRAKHTQILKDNMDKLRIKVNALMSERDVQNEMVRSLRAENGYLRSQLNNGQEISIRNAPTTKSSDAILGPEEGMRSDSRNKELFFPADVMYKRRKRPGDALENTNYMSTDTVPAKFGAKRPRHEMVRRPPLFHGEEKNVPAKAMSSTINMNVERVGAAAQIAPPTIPSSPSSMAVTTQSLRRDFNSQYQPRQAGPLFSTGRCNRVLSRQSEYVKTSRAMSKENANFQRSGIRSQIRKIDQNMMERYRGTERTSVKGSNGYDVPRDEAFATSKKQNGVKGITSSKSEYSRNNTVNPGALSRFARSSRIESVNANPRTPGFGYPSGIVPRPSARFAPPARSNHPNR